MEELQKQLNIIQQTLKAPKNQFSKFGNYNYRSCEDILEAVKPLLDGLILTISDEIVNLGNRFYVKATVKLIKGKESINVSACARETETRVKFDEAQLTGSASSYARKYALNGLFAIDDTKDVDGQDNTKALTKPKKVKANPKKIELIKKMLEANQKTDAAILKALKVKSLAEISETQADGIINKLQEVK